ncbi:MAG: peptide chain release factor N(5)-glutamine methyltransferase [Leptospiraceae bacterium]|nr:peptide chain release factor N(5)-glutamine methyltransferase [Leptospiraceae bacterium]MCK6379974.1 peptide chain release factor N(5)-glutamine methyltransferase [Leptospiraceae bacterium]NUM40065.1 peptide chain release factor N(5)-glutamine methyltransferase [Leptospiraceae bacterium]
MITNGKTILYVLNKSKEYLEKKNIPNPRLDAEIILSDVLKLERIKLYSNFERVLTLEEENDYRKKIQERGNFKPVAYIVHKKMFYDSNFYVDENVLIPRPETEELVEWYLQIRNSHSALTVLDLCCGSGCIGISIQKTKPESRVVFSDISISAINIAKQNFKNILGREVLEGEFYESDLMSNLDRTILYDDIISNPPYIPESEKLSIMKDVIEYEPEIALFLKNPDEFYPKLLSETSHFLKNNGNVFMESHPDWIYKISELSKNFQFDTIEIKKDLSGKERFIRLRKKEE